MKYLQANKDELIGILDNEKNIYADYQKQGLSLDITRGKPCREQLDLSNSLFDDLSFTQGNVDCRNYGGLEGLPELRDYFATLFDITRNEILVQGNSSLNLIYDTIQRGFQFGYQGSKPWNKLDKIKFLCPVPGYDRHFKILELFGIDMISVPMNECGPDMDMIEELVENDDSVKGMICVPKYSNPTGIVFSDDIVSRLASMKTAAEDFRIFWDNAYCVHTLYENDDSPLKNIIQECKAQGNNNRVFMFASTSKITFAGAGVAIVASSEENINELKKSMTVQSIGPDKINQSAHLDFFKKVDLKEQMNKHANILLPKFKIFLNAFNEEFGADCDIFTWIEPKGGYFISVNVYNGTAKKVEKLCADCGLKITPAGATYPYGLDDNDSNLRIAPSFIQNLDDITVSAKILISAIKISAIEKIIEERE